MVQRAERRRQERKQASVAGQRSFLQSRGISVREGAVLDPASPDFDYAEYQKSQAIKQFIASDPASVTRRKQGDVAYAKAQEQAKLNQYNRILQQQTKFMPSRESIAEARAGGADPRTIAAYVAEGDRLAAGYKYVLDRKNKPGAVGSFYGKRAEVIREEGVDPYVGDFFMGKRVGMGKSNLSLLEKDITARSTSEGAVQRQLAEIRRQRKSLIQEQQQTFTQRRGSRALLASPAGGSGFLQGYFR